MFPTLRMLSLSLSYRSRSGVSVVGRVLEADDEGGVAFGESRVSFGEFGVLAFVRESRVVRVLLDGGAEGGRGEVFDARLLRDGLRGRVVLEVARVAEEAVQFLALGAELFELLAVLGRAGAQVRDVVELLAVAAELVLR